MTQIRIKIKWILKSTGGGHQNSHGFTRKFNCKERKKLHKNHGSTFDNNRNSFKFFPP